MRKLCQWTGATVVSAVGWALGSRVGLGTAFVVSMVGTGVGWWAGDAVARHLGG